MTMRPYRVVDDFEAALCEYTGARFAVAVNSCSNALMLAALRHLPQVVYIPQRTYCSVPMAMIHAGHRIRFVPGGWVGEYRLQPLPVWDCARRFNRGMYRAGQFMCVSFQTSKILGIEQGGAILHDDAPSDEWFRRARFDGRLNAEEKLPQMIGQHCYMNPSTAALGLARLAALPERTEPQVGSTDFERIDELPIWGPYLAEAA